jgi:undecaprenyl-diphosphatase
LNVFTNGKPLGSVPPGSGERGTIMQKQLIGGSEAAAARHAPRLRVHRSDAELFVLAYALLTGVWFLIGKAILASTPLTKADANAARWFAEHRTPRLNHLTAIGSGLSETLVKIVVTVIIAGVMGVVWRRWKEPMMVGLPLILEAMVFITVTVLVDRPRPDVPRLESSPVGSSFPSGHAAAAVVYSAMLIVVFWHTRRWWIRVGCAVVTTSVAVIVGLSRVYRGMHHVTDVVAGFALGAASIAVCWWLIQRADDRFDRSAGVAGREVQGPQ